MKMISAMLTLMQRQRENGTVMIIRNIEMAVIRNAVIPGPSGSAKKENDIDLGDRVTNIFECLEENAILGFAFL